MPGIFDTNIFEGRLVRLRAPEPADDAPFRRWVREDTDSGRMTYRIPFPEPAEQAISQQWFPPLGDNAQFAIETLNGVLVGSIDAHECNSRNGTFMLGIGILPEHRQNGYASEAIRLLLNFYFYEMRYQKCHSMVFSFNAASIRLHERAGFVLEARLRRMIYTQGAYHDELRYGLTAEEFATLDTI